MQKKNGTFPDWLHTLLAAIYTVHTCSSISISCAILSVPYRRFFVHWIGLFDDVKQAKLKIQITTIQVIKKQKKNYSNSKSNKINNNNNSCEFAVDFFDSLSVFCSINYYTAIERKSLSMWIDLIKKPEQTEKNNRNRQSRS